MALLTWSDKYSVGVRELDEQHQKLVAMINELHDAMKAGQGKTALAQILQSMAEYTQSHFAAEEKYMTRFQYPEYVDHKLAHQQFIWKVSDFREAFDKGQASLSLEVMNFLKDWLSQHIVGVDKRYGPFLNQHGIH